MTDSGLKATQQRIVIYEALYTSKDHPTAEKILDSIKKNNPSLSLGTVYKTLDTFVSMKIANKVMSDNGVYRYDANTNFHNHIYCENTGELIDYENEELTFIIQQFFKNKKLTNLTIRDIRLQINGNKIDPEKDIWIN